MDEGCFAMDTLGGGSSAHAVWGQRPTAVQLETPVPAGLPHRNTARSKVLQAKFRERSGKNLVGASERDPCHTGGERER